MEADFESRLFPDIGKEAEARSSDTGSPERFGFLSLVGDILRDVIPEDAPAEALDEYRALLYHAFHFWREGRQLFVLDRAVARFIVEARPEGGERAVPPGRSGYIQLPANLFWSSITPDVPPEPVDGFFFTESAEEEGSDVLRRLHLLYVLGIHRARAGFSVIRFEADIGEDSLTDTGAGRPEGDFTSILPGGEMSGLYSILTTAEALKLPVRVFRYMDEFPEAVVPSLPAEPDENEELPPVSRLGFSLVSLTSTES